MNNRDKIVELDKFRKSKKLIPYNEFFLSFRRAAHACYRRDKKFMTILKEEYMIRSSVKDLMCEDSRLRDLMSIPVSEILRYSDMADNIDPEEALRYLADLFIDNCGQSLGMRGFADYCAGYWINKLDLNNPALKEKYQDAQTLGQLLPYISDRYYDGLLDEYDSCAMSAIELREDLVYMLETVTDDKAKIILCAGICHCLSMGDGICWLDRYSMSEIEAGIVNFKNLELIRYRQWEDFQRYRTWQHIKIGTDTPAGLRKLAERWPDEFSEAEVSHFIVLNDRLVELQREVMEQVKVITANLRQQIAIGFHQYDTFVIDGYIYVEAYEEDNTDELLDSLSSFAKYSVMCSNDETSQKHLAEEISDDAHWYANWGGVFHQLEESHGLKLCRAFRHLFEDSEVFTIGDIMKIKPDMLLPHVEINI